MAQSTFDDEDLFTEASSEMQEDVEDAVQEARESLPDPSEIMRVEGDNVIGVLNNLKSGLDIGDAGESLREAKKWFSMGKRADAFDDEFTTRIEKEIGELEEAVNAVQRAEQNATELTDSVATLKNSL